MGDIYIGGTLLDMLYRRDPAGGGMLYMRDPAGYVI